MALTDQLTEPRPNIGLAEKEENALVDMLNRNLANAYVLYTKYRNYHWNVFGPNFNNRHVFFEKQFNELILMIDVLAERVRQVGGVTIGSMAEFIKYSTLSEEPAGSVPDDLTMVANLLKDNEAVIRHYREDVRDADAANDVVTADMLTNFMKQHEQMSWMLRATLG